MKTIEATITRQGQITIAADVRSHLKLTKPGKVAFRIDDAGGVRLVPVTSTLESVFASVPPLPDRETADFEDQIAEAMEDEADRIVDELAGR